MEEKKRISEQIRKEKKLNWWSDWIGGRHECMDIIRVLCLHGSPVRKHWANY